MINLTISIKALSLEIWYTSQLVSWMLNQPLPTSLSDVRMCVLKIVIQLSRKNSDTWKIKLYFISLFYFDSSINNL